MRQKKIELHELPCIEFVKWGLIGWQKCGTGSSACLSLIFTVHTFPKNSSWGKIRCRKLAVHEISETMQIQAKKIILAAKLHGFCFEVKFRVHFRMETNKFASQRKSWIGLLAWLDFQYFLLNLLSLLQTTWLLLISEAKFRVELRIPLLEIPTHSTLCQWYFLPSSFPSALFVLYIQYIIYIVVAPPAGSCNSRRAAIRIM